MQNIRESLCMKFIRFIVLSLLLAPFGAFAAPSDFTVAAQLLAAAKNADIQQVQVLVNNGANINYVDSTGLSLVCTALMNNDLRAAQILQMYGADASQCDRQIKRYRTQNSPGTTGGLFGGLSTAQGLTLAAAGAAVIVGGLYLLTDVFDHDNDNHASSSGSGGGGGGGSGGGGDNPSGNGTAWSVGALPYGPAMLNATMENANYANNLALYYTQYDSENEETIYYKDFYLMNNYAGAASQNYLLLMRGYSPLARGYLGMRTLRNTTTHEPLVLRDSLDNPIYNLGDYSVMGGRPVNVALITANGINAVDGSSLQDRLLLWTINSGPTSLNEASNSMLSSKYYNNTVILGANNASITDDTSAEDIVHLSEFDLSNSGTAIHNGSAIFDDNLLGKIVGGNFETGYNGDFAGFMPNGQMTIYRTGGGRVMVAGDNSVAGSYTFADPSNVAVGDTMTFSSTGVTATVASVVSSELGDDTKSITWSYQSNDQTKYYYGYFTGDLYYVDFDADGMADVAYLPSGGSLLLAKQISSENVDYYNYTALVNALARTGLANDTSGGRSRVDIIANADVIEPLHSRSAYTVQDVISSNFSQAYFLSFVEAAYGGASTVNNLIPLNNAQTFFNTLGGIALLNQPLTIFSTGASLQNTGALYADALQPATFENAAPLVFNNLSHSFMSIVAVGASTQGETTIAANSDSNPSQYTLAQWSGNVDGDTQYYKSRICGIAGRGTSSMDPWCFASVGITDEMAVAAAAGAAGTLRSAFYYMTPQEIFTLLALTADGPYLNRLTAGTQLTQTALIAHLQSLYDMPDEYQYRIDEGLMTYLDAFKEVFGYGVINLERATTPGTNLYFHTNGRIVSTNGNAYWRAAVNTGLRASSVLNLGRVAINTAAYDMLESVDGSMSLPRIWEHSVSFGNNSRSALYMGDVLGDLHVRAEKDNTMNIGNMSFGFSRSERAYNDSMGGLDNMRFGYSLGDWELTADYQHYLTDNESRFYGMANPILALASRATTGGVSYNLNKWSFGARGFSGAVTDEGLLENDPTISSLNEPMRLGTISGAQSEIGWGGEKFGFHTSFGAMRESNTILGAYATGLMDVGNADTEYVDVDAFWKVGDMLKLRARATFAHTTSDMTSGTIFGMSELDSNAFALGADVGNINLGVSMPLAVVRGNMTYDGASYEIVDAGDGHYDLAISDTGIRNIDMASSRRELRLNATYRHKFGPFTDGAIGFIYRINPNNTDEFGNESIFMMKVSHLLGI